MVHDGKIWTNRLRSIKIRKMTDEGSLTTNAIRATLSHNESLCVNSEYKLSL